MFLSSADYVIPHVFVFFHHQFLVLFEHGRQLVESFCCQVLSEPRLDMQMSRTNFEAVALPKQRDVPLRSCHLQLLKRPDIGGTMPSENKSFTPSSILFRPQILI